MLAYYECGPEVYDLKKKMIHEVLMQYFDEPFFNQLRTLEQLGYIVFCNISSYRDILGARFIVSSAKYSAEYCLNSLYQFLHEHKEKIRTITEEDFKQ